MLKDIEDDVCGCEARVCETAVQRQVCYALYPCTCVQMLSPLVQMAGGGALPLFSKSQLIRVLSSGLYEKLPFDYICILDKSYLTFGISCAM